MAKTIEHIHWPNAPDMWMPYAPAITVTGGTTVEPWAATCRGGRLTGNFDLMNRPLS